MLTWFLIMTCPMQNPKTSLSSECRDCTSHVGPVPKHFSGDTSGSSFSCKLSALLFSQCITLPLMGPWELEAKMGRQQTCMASESLLCWLLFLCTTSRYSSMFSRGTYAMLHFLCFRFLSLPLIWLLLRRFQTQRSMEVFIVRLFGSHWCGARLGY